MINRSLIEQAYPTALFPEENFIVLGLSAGLSSLDITTLQQAGIEALISLQPNEATAAEEKILTELAGIAYYHVPIRGEQDLKQTVIMQLDKALRAQYGKNVAIYARQSDYVGAAMALRAGWLRGRKVETAMATGKAYGLTTLESEVHKRILVPR